MNWSIQNSTQDAGHNTQLDWQHSCFSSRAFHMSASRRTWQLHRANLSQRRDGSAAVVMHTIIECMTNSRYASRVKWEVDRQTYKRVVHSVTGHCVTDHRLTALLTEIGFHRMFVETVDRHMSTNRRTSCCRSHDLPALRMSSSSEM